MIKKHLTAVLLLIGTTATADNTFSVSTKIYRDADLLGTPSMLVTGHQPSQVEVEGVYHLALTVSPLDNNTASISTTIEVKGRVVRPVMMIEYGKPVKFEFDQYKFAFEVNKKG